MFVYLNYFKNQNYHKYTHLLQIHFDFSCTDLFHGFHHVNVRHDLFRYFCIDFSFYFLFIIDTIRDRIYYKIPFCSSPPSVYLSNNMSGLKNANFVDTVLQDLLHRY
jgi:hypothetical protein